MTDSSERFFIERIERLLQRERRVLDSVDLAPAAVLVPLVFRDSGPTLVFTKRTMSVATHKGQVSFPGGAREKEDEDEADTAIREAHEEVGLEGRYVRVLGMLDDMATSSGFLITPVVGILDPDASFECDPEEVAELFEVSLEALSDEANHDIISHSHLGRIHRHHRYTIGDRVIWGATAAIVFDLLTLLARAGR